ASEADLAFLEQAELDAKRIKQCLRDLQQLPPMSVMADTVNLGERFCFLDHVMMVNRHGIWYLEAMSAIGPAQARDPLRERLQEQVMENIDFDPALRIANSSFDRLVAAMRLQDRAARAKQFDRVAEEWK